MGGKEERGNVLRTRKWEGKEERCFARGNEERRKEEMCFARGNEEMRKEEMCFARGNGPNREVVSEQLIATKSKSERSERSKREAQPTDLEA